jgi:parvulin-like peptidyl-prolyl isomerase
LAKKKVEKPQHIMTPRQISRWEQQQKRQRLIFIAGISVIALVLVFVGMGWYYGRYKPMHETAIEVNGTEFTMGYFVDMLKLESTYQTGANISSLADTVMEDIQRNELVRQGALKLGISIDDDEVKKAIEKNGLPDKEANRALVSSQLLTQRLLDEYFDPQVPLSAEQRQVMAMMLESEQQALEVRDRLVNGEDFSQLAKEMSLELYSKNMEGDLGWVPKLILQDMLPTSIVDEIFNQKVGELSQPIYDGEAQKQVGYWLVKVLERNEEQDETHIQVMLLSSEEEAQNIRQQLEAGADWGELAVAHSQAKGVETNLGEYQVSKGMAVAPIDEYAYNPDTQIGEISQPLRDEDITTKGGYWLIKVLDEDTDRRIDTNYRQYLKTKALNEWATTLFNSKDNEIVNYLDPEKKAWAIEQAQKG